MQLLTPILAQASGNQEAAIAANKQSPDLIPAAAMAARITEARSQGDSVGGVIEGRITGVPPGLGEPIYDKLDAMLKDLK